MSLIRISESDDWIVDYDRGRGMYRVSYFEDNHFKDEHWFDCFEEKELTVRNEAVDFSHLHNWFIDSVGTQEIDKAPTLDVVSRGVFDQVMWERNVALAQLEELGLSLGQKIEYANVVPKEQYEDLRDAFVDYVCSGVRNQAPYCKNSCDECVDSRGWCTYRRCRGFNPDGRTYDN